MYDKRRDPKTCLFSWGHAPVINMVTWGTGSPNEHIDFGDFSTSTAALMLALILG